MAARRAQAARAASHLASSSNLAATTGASPAVRSNNAARLKATSMTNLQASATQPATTNSLKRPASRNALDNIHKGMNAKFTHVQSKVLLQNIRPQGGAGGGNSKIPANNRASSPASRSGGTLQRLAPAATPTTRRSGTPTASKTTLAGAQSSVQSDRSQLINRIRALQEELAERERERDDLRQELERERTDRTEQVAAAKGELEAKALEAERQSEEYHQKLIEAYELADQNRRAADNVLSESRQREDELRKKIDELESQLGELREFVAMKEEMMGKMGELREQIRVERERYEEKTRSLHQMFENEKISGHQVDQNSNYFRRQKPSLQSVESINRLSASGVAQTMAGCSDQEGAHTRSQRKHQSEQDIYGSKLSTRMQDGARAAWKKSRKFASSVITGGLGGLSACRKHNISGKRVSSASSQAAASSEQPARTMLHVHALPQEGHQFGPCPIVQGAQSSSSSGAGNGLAPGEQHTSVVEVGATVGDYMCSHQVVTQAPTCNTNAPVSDDQRSEIKPRSSVRVDENNKLTIVTKFNDELAVEAHPSDGVASSSSHSDGQGSERSRCESSSSGRGTSECGSPAGSQSGDRDEHQFLSERQRTAHAERKSSLFKPDEQTGADGLNKTLKSFFAHAANSAATAKARQQQQHEGQNNDSEIAIAEPQANFEFVRHEQGRPNQGEAGHLQADATTPLSSASVVAVESH